MSKVTMPEPVAYFYQRDFDKYKDRYPEGIPVITIDQAEAYADACVREALTEVLEVADKYNEFAIYDVIKVMLYKDNTTNKFSNSA